MRKVFLLGILLLLIALPTKATKVTKAEAIAIAQKAMPNRKFIYSEKARAKRNGELSNDSVVPYYILNATEGGFVIVSGDDRAPEILGYSLSGNLNSSTAPSNVKWLLDYYDYAINQLSEETPPSKARKSGGLSKADIAPMINTTWGQGTPYNDQCPEFGGKCLTGCVATAMAQVINYYQWPENATASINGYTTKTHSIFMPELSAATFYWDNMTNSEIAKLMLYCGQSVLMDYGVEESGAFAENVPAALAKSFGYDSRVKLVNRRSYTSDSWIDLLYQEVAEGRPVLYGGESTQGGHMFILHGYQEGKFYINWGWNGDFDGYYEIDLLNPSNYNFASNHSAIVGIQEPSGNSEEKKIYNNTDLHLYFYLNPNTLEAMVGTGIDHTLANAVARPPIGDVYWNNPTNLWENIDIPSTITYGGRVYSVTSVAPYAFFKNTDIKHVRLPETIRSIGENAFYWCVNLEDINIPSEVTSIESETFVLCRKIESIHLPNKVRYIGFKAFSDCVGLKEINIPGACTSIGNDAFTWCKSLHKLTIEDGTETLRMGCTNNVGLDYYPKMENKEDGQAHQRGQFADCILDDIYLGRDISYPSGVDWFSKKERAFPPFEICSEYLIYYYQKYAYSGPNLNRLEIGEKVTIIPDLLFTGSQANVACEIALPSNLKTIGVKAFYGSLNQSEITLPATLEEIKEDAFGGCNFEVVYSHAVTPPVSPSTSPLGNCIIYVPSGSGALYREKWTGVIVDFADELISVNVRTAGTLLNRLLAQDHQPSDVTRLKLKGNLNDNDIETIRNMSNLFELDLSELETQELPEGIVIANLARIKLPNTLTKVKDGELSVPYLSGVIEIPSTCNSIGVGAFRNTRIEGVIFTKAIEISSEAFMGCSKITSLEIMAGMTIGDHAFAGTAIQSIVIPTNSTIGNGAFSTSSLKEVTIEDGVKSIGNNAFGSKFEKISFRGAVESVGSIGSDKLTEVRVCDITTWCNLMFPDGSLLANAPHLIINETELTDVVIPNSVDKIRPYLFYNCHSLNNITLHSNINQIGAYAFAGCSAIANINLPSSISQIGAYAFARCSAIADINLPMSTMEIGNGAFSGCESLETINLPSNLTSIGNNTFENCTSLKRIMLPVSVGIIGDRAFSGCSSLTKIDIPLNVSTIGTLAFNGCSDLSQVLVHWENPFTLESDIFSGISSDCYLYVPIVCAQKYIDAGWNSVFKNLKEAGVLTIKVNSGGTVICNDVSLTNTSVNIIFTPYKSFYVILTPDEGNKIMRLSINGNNKLPELENNKLFIEEPEENMSLSVIFADASIQQGDVNGDKIINENDARLVVNYLLKYKPEMFHDYWADVNGDGDIDVTDAILIIKNHLVNNQ